MPAGNNVETISKWHWTFDNLTTAAVQNPSTYFNAGMHNARLIAETSVGCKGVALDQSFEIYSKPKIKLDISDSCVFVPITYAANDMDGNVIRWDWDFGSGFQAGPSNITMTYNTEGNRPFTVITHTDKGCRDTIYRPFAIFNNLSYAGKDTVAAVNEPVQLFGRGETNMQYIWSPSTGLNDPNIENPVAILDKDQLYKLYTTTEKGCRKQTQILIKRCNGPDLYVPSAFTPNNDGLNDKLKVFPVGIKSFGYLAVYDRWGQLMFRTTNYHQGWDGTFKGTQLSTGTFIYMVQAIDYKGKELFRKGTVTLIK
jgi:gliding motility-associated-like protein